MLNSLFSLLSQSLPVTQPLSLRPRRPASDRLREAVPVALAVAALVAATAALAQPLSQLPQSPLMGDQVAELPTAPTGAAPAALPAAGLVTQTPSQIPSQALSQAPSVAHAFPATTLPAAVQAALARARIPAGAVSMYVAPVGGGVPRLAWQAQAAMNPASVMKLVTTYAALDLLGPAHVWSTDVYLDGPISQGTLHGNLYIRGEGDPQLGAERLWQLLSRLQGLGIHTIAGDIVADRSAFQTPPHDAGAFDGEALRPYNAGPDALLVNYKTQILHFMPDSAAGVARIHYEPPLTGIAGPVTVPLAPPGTACGDWRGQLRMDWSQPQQLHLAGQYPASCGAKAWPVAPSHAGDFALRAIAGMWHGMGGQVRGVVRQGQVPPGQTPAWSLTSPALAEIVRGINKYSNNVMTQQVLLTLGLQRQGMGTFEAGRAAIAQWWSPRWGDAAALVVDNGAGLSREARITARSLGRMLESAWASSVMPEFMASLPVAGLDGTLRRSRANASAHLKTGSLRDVNALAGYVLGRSGQRYVLVALVNHGNAGAARPALDALVDWVGNDG